MQTKNNTLSRRAMLRAGAASLLVPVIGTRAVFAQAAYPAKPVTFICAFPAGSGADVFVRFYAHKFQEITGQTVIVDNRPGAASNIAAEYTMRAAPDGYTLMVHAGNSVAGNVHLLKNPPLNPATDLRTIAVLHEQAFFAVVAADSPHQNLDDLVADLRAKGADGSYASSTVSGIVLCEEFKRIAGLETEQIRYNATAESVNDLLAGHVDFGCYDPAFAVAQHNNGTMRILGLAYNERMDGIPDIPTFAEQGYELAQPGWWGVLAPKDLPDDLATQINDIFRQVLELPETAQYVRDNASRVRIATPDESQQLMEDSVDDWARLIEIAGIEPQ